MLSKKEQLKNNGSQKKKLCKNCGRLRNLKFFTSTSARECLDCQRKKKFAKKTGSMTAVEKKLDVKWSEKVRSIGHCEYCGKKENLNAHHIFSRNNKSVRWDLENGICLCAGCHTFSSRFSAHQTPTEFTQWLMKYKGMELLDRLTLKALGTKKWTKEGLLELLENL